MRIKGIPLGISASFLFPALLALFLLTTSCVHDKPDIGFQTDDGSTQIQLNIVTRSMNSDSETYETGTIWENLIDIEGGDYRIYFFTNDKDDAVATDASGKNTLIAELDPENLDVVAVSGSSYTKYTIIGRVDEEIAAYSSLKIVAVANWGTYPAVAAGETTIDDLVENLDAQFSIEDYLPTSTGFTNERLMPFYGVNEYSGLVWKEGWRTILDGDLTLLRALAKVEVVYEPEDDDDDVTFDAVRIVRYNSTGYCAPSNVYLKEDYDHNGVWAEDYTSDVHLVGGGNDSEEKSFDFWQADDNTWLIYLPEYDNMGDDYCHIEVETDEVVYPIYFANYYEGFTDAYSEDETDLSDRYDVYRNCYYRFITELGGDVWELSMDVKQYTAPMGIEQVYFTFSDYYYEQDDENMSIGFNVLDATSTFVMIPTLLYNEVDITSDAEWTCECTSAPETSVIVTKSPTVSDGPVEIHVTTSTATPGYVHNFILTAGWDGNDGKERSITYTIAVTVVEGWPGNIYGNDVYIKPSTQDPNSVGTSVSAPAESGRPFQQRVGLTRKQKQHKF